MLSEICTHNHCDFIVHDIQPWENEKIEYGKQSVKIQCTRSSIITVKENGLQVEVVLWNEKKNDILQQQFIITKEKVRS